MTNKPDPDITVKLSDLLVLLLGDSFSEPFPPGFKHIAEIIEAKAKGTFMCHVQWQGMEGEKLDEPILWVYAKWCESSERWQRAKKLSDDRRAAKFVFDANVKMVSHYCKRYFLMDDTWAITTAFGLVNKNRLNGIKQIGVEKLYESVDEIND